MRLSLNRCNTLEHILDVLYHWKILIRKMITTRTESINNILLEIPKRIEEVTMIHTAHLLNATLFPQLEIEGWWLIHSLSEFS